MATLPTGASQIHTLIDILVQKIVTRIESLQSIDLMHDYPNIHNVLQNRIHHFLPNLYRTLDEKAFMRSGDDDEDVCNICMTNKAIVNLPCCTLNLCAECGHRLVNNHVLKCPQCTTKHPETVITSFVGNLFHQLTLVEAAVNIYQTRNIEGLGITRATMNEWLACIDRMLSLEPKEEERTKIIEKMVYFGLTKELCHLFQKGWFTNYKFREFLDTLIFKTNNRIHKNHFETIKRQLTELCNLKIPFTSDSCLDQLNASYDIMMLVSKLFEILLLPFRTTFSGKFDQFFKVPLSAIDLLMEMEGLKRHYFSSIGIENIQRVENNFDIQRNFENTIKNSVQLSALLIYLMYVGVSTFKSLSE